MSPIEPLEISDLLAHLVERSLVVFDPQTGRYHLTESMRVYAHDALGDEEDAIRRKHFEYFSKYAEPMRYLALDGDDVEILRRFVQEVDNLRTAMEWASAHDSRAYLHLASTAGSPWVRSYAQEGSAHFLNALASAPEEDDDDHIWTRIHFAQIKWRMAQQNDVRELLQKALRQLDVHDIPLARVAALLRLSWYWSWAGDLEQTRELCDQAVELCNIHNYKQPQILAYLFLGEMARHREDWREAIRCYKAALPDGHEMGILAMTSYFNLGCTFVQLDDLKSAEANFLCAIRCNESLFQGSTTAVNAADGLGGLGCVFTKRGDFRRGGLLLGGWEGRLRTQGISVDPLDRAFIDEVVGFGRENGGEVFEAAFEEGKTLPVKAAKEIPGIPS